MRYILLCLLVFSMLLAAPYTSAAQEKIIQTVAIPDTTLQISGISIIGNDKTRSYIIQRELRFAKGDTVHARELADRIRESQQLIYNTNLFTTVEIYPELSGDRSLHLTVTVRERWYIYPVPLFKLSDRNLNEWINTYDADPDRIIYGARFVHYNLSGRRDKLEINLMNGFARNITFQYSSPYSNPALTEGFSALLSYTENREIPVKTGYNNKLQFARTGGFIKQNYTAGGTWSRRRGYYRTHTFGFNYVFTNVKDTVLSETLNPDYFNSSRAYHNYPELHYTFQYLDVNNMNYPLTGTLGKFSLLKRGHGWRGNINNLELSGAYSRYLNLKRGWYFSSALSGKVTLPFKLAYQNQKALGYLDYNLRGLDNYVVDGVASVLTKQTIKKRLGSFDIPSPILKSIVPSVPFTFFLKAFGDAGYVHQTVPLQTYLSNRMLYTYGFGMDIVTLYDLTLQLDYAFNQLKENGLFLQFRFTF